MLEIAIRRNDLISGKLLLDARCMRRFTALEPKVISIARLFDAERRRVERFIEKVFLDKYGAGISHHYPTLMSVQDEHGEILAAVGFRAADEERLFLEDYLAAPVGQVLEATVGAKVRRRDIVEIGSLAATGQGASIFLFVAAAAYLRQQGFTHAVVTATAQLRRAFTFMRFKPFELGTADQSRLSDSGDTWGTYYDTDPKVLAARIAPCFRWLERLLPAQSDADLGRMFSRLHYRSNTGSEG